MDLSKRSTQELKNLLVNNAKHGKTSTVTAVVREMHHRGLATAKEYRYLAWNQSTVREKLAPFKEVAKSVIGNKRVAYSEAGGRRVGRLVGDPQGAWIDSYSGIKRGSTNVVLACYVKQPGDDPEFQLQRDGKLVRSFNADGLAMALLEWRAIAAGLEQE